MAPKTSSTQQRLQQMGDTFGQTADSVYFQLMDLNIPTIGIRTQLEQLLLLRDNMINIAQGKKQVSGIVPLGGAAAGAGGGDDNWKKDLHEAIAKATKAVLTKGDITYTHQELRHGETATRFVATITCASFTNSYQGEEAVSKKQAEQLAAKEALKGEFPDIFSAKSVLSEAMIQPAASSGGRKRQREEPAQVEPKGRLNQALAILMARPLTKADLSYETVQANPAEPLSFISTLTLICYDNMVVTGAQVEGKKAAEQSAAEAALNALKNVLGPAEEEHRAKKKAKNAEALRLLKEKDAEKKAAKKAEEGVVAVAVPKAAGKPGAKGMIQPKTITKKEK